MNTIARGGATSAVGYHMVPKLAELAGRILLATLFLISGLGKVGQYGGTAAYMASAGVPGELLPAVIALEIGGAIALMVGWQTRIASLLLAAFTLVAGVIFHGNVGDPEQFVHFFKNVSIVGGLLLLIASGAGPLSLDRRSRSSPASSSTDTIV